MTPLFMREVFEMRKRQAIAEAEERGLMVCSACEIEVHSAEQVHCGECEKKQMRRYARMVTPRSKWTPQDQNEEYEERVARAWRNLTQRLHAGKRTFSKTIQQQRVQKALFRAHLRRPEMRERIALARTNATISQLMSHLEGCCRCARCRGCGRRRHREGLFTAFRRVMTKR